MNAIKLTIKNVPVVKALALISMARQDNFEAGFNANGVYVVADDKSLKTLLKAWRFEQFECCWIFADYVEFLGLSRNGAR